MEVVLWGWTPNAYRTRIIALLIIAGMFKSVIIILIGAIQWERNEDFTPKWIGRNERKNDIFRTKKSISFRRT